MDIDQKIEITVKKTIDAIARIDRFIIKYGSKLNTNQLELISNRLQELQKHL